MKDISTLPPEVQEQLRVSVHKDKLSLSISDIELYYQTYTWYTGHIAARTCAKLCQQVYLLVRNIARKLQEISDNEKVLAAQTQQATEIEEPKPKKDETKKRKTKDN
jgi:hypothetical protein